MFILFLFQGRVLSTSGPRRGDGSVSPAAPVVTNLGLKDGLPGKEAWERAGREGELPYRHCVRKEDRREVQ